MSLFGLHGWLVRKALASHQGDPGSIPVKCSAQIPVNSWGVPKSVVHARHVISSSRGQGHFQFIKGNSMESLEVYMNLLKGPLGQDHEQQSPRNSKPTM